MTPIRTTRSNFVYRGPTPDIGDLWVERIPEERVVKSSWLLTEGEMKGLNDGSLQLVVELGIYGMEPIPPVSLAIVPAVIVDAKGPPKTTTEVIDMLGGHYADRQAERPPRPPAPPKDGQFG